MGDVMGYLQKVRDDIRDAALIAREGVTELRVNNGVGHAYGELGRMLAQLHAAGERIPESLEPQLARIRSIESGLQSAAAQDGAA
jgi:Ser/Thr protein kinase RdoA (MazF antagonist)